MFFVLLERASLRFRRLEPKIVSIYDPYFWFHERHWKLSDSPITGAVRRHAVPKHDVSRVLGMKVGRKVFDGGCSITERTLTEVGDYANLNEGSVLQAHSLEEGVFKSDYIRIGSGCSIGPGAFVHYGVTHGRPRRARRRFLPDEGRSARVRIPAGAAIRRSWCAAMATQAAGRLMRSRRDEMHRCASRRSEAAEARLARRARQERMREDVKLKDVTADNWRAVIGLELDAEQEDLVASNLYSIAESQFDPDARPRAVYAGKRVVGFLMYDVQQTRQSRKASIYRFMIDRKHQGKGYGRAALSRALDEIRAIPGMKKVSIRYMPENPVAKPFYASFGFVEVGKDEDGEIIAELAL